MKSLTIFFLLFVFVGISTAETTADPNYFPISVWWQKTSNAQTFKNAGVNMYITAEDLTATTFGHLKAAGMKVICPQDNGVSKYMLTQAADPAVYAWVSHLDEPDNSNPSYYGDCTPISVVIKSYNAMKAADPTHPVYLNLGMGVSYLEWVGRGTCVNKWWMYSDTIVGRGSYKNGYLKACDIVSFDIYPVNSKYSNIQGNLYYVSKGVDSLISWSKQKVRPTWTWIETTKFAESTPAPSRKPTATEVKAEVWMALIHGATGIGYFAHITEPSSVFDQDALLKDAPMMAAITNINKEIASLAPVLNSTTIMGFATANSSNTAVPVDIMSKHVGLSHYLFAVPMRNGTTTATFNTTNSTATSVEVIGENRTIPIVAGKFTDSFSPYAVHLYRMDAPNAPAGLNDEKIKLPNMYPNPMEDMTTLDMANETNFPYFLNVTDLQGRIVKSMEINNALTNIYRNDLRSGMYFFTVRNKQNKTFVTQKVSMK